MSEGLFNPDPFTVAPVVEPKLSADRKRTIKRQQLIANGIHPATKVKLLDNGETCGSCAHLLVSKTRPGKSWFKCGLLPITNGPGSDIRVGWPACEKWQERTES